MHDQILSEVASLKKAAAQTGWRTLGAFDIETDTSPDPFVYPNGSISNHPAGLDPRVSRVTSITLATDDGGVVIFDGGDEKAMIDAFFDYITTNYLTLVGWNTMWFDLPFMKVRRTGRDRWEMLSFSHGREDSPHQPKYGYPEWSELVADYSTFSLVQVGKSMTGRIHHYDLAPMFAGYAAAKGVKHSLKPVARSLGIDMIEVNASKMHELTQAERIAYNVSDAKGVLQLVGKLDAIGGVG